MPFENDHRGPVADRKMRFGQIGMPKCELTASPLALALGATALYVVVTPNTHSHKFAAGRIETTYSSS